MLLHAGQIVVVDYRDALPKEPNKIRPCVVVEDADLFDPSYPNVIVVPLTDDARFVIQALAVEIPPTPENGSTKTSYAVAHCVTTASKQRIGKATESCVTDEQLAQIRRRIAECIGLQTANAASAEKSSAVGTEAYFRERAARGDVPPALEIIDRTGVSAPPLPGDEA
jgi:mRNA interferase MazF